MKSKILHLFVLLTLLIGLLATTPATPARASTLTVDTLTDEEDGSCLDGDCSLRDAVAAAANNDTITFSVNGTLTLTLDEIAINKDLTLNGPGSSKLTIDANQASRHFNISSGKVVTLSGMTLTNGQVTGSSGGSIYNAGSLILNQMVLSQNKTLGSMLSGGAIYTNGNLAITDSILSGNSAAGSGGAIATISGISLVLTNTVFDGNNSALEGGAIDLSSDMGFVTTMYATNVTMANNTAGYDGGALSAGSYAEVIIDGSLFDSNKATDKNGFGGALSLGGNSLVTISNTMFSNNISQRDGGAIYATSAQFDVTNTTFNGNQVLDASNGLGGAVNFSSPNFANFKNVTITNNTSAYSGGGIYILTSGGGINFNNVTVTDNHAAYTGGLYIFDGVINTRNSIIAHNTDDDAGNYEDCGGVGVGEWLVTQGHNLVGVPEGCGFVADTGDIIGQDPLLGPLANNGGPVFTRALLAGSPALDAGDNSTCEFTDARGVDRPQDGNSDLTNKCDMGAYEKLPPIVTPTFADVPMNYWAWQHIEGLYRSGITGGCSASPLNYCPSVTVTRDQMAVFLLRGIHGSAYNASRRHGRRLRRCPRQFLGGGLDRAARRRGHHRWLRWREVLSLHACHPRPDSCLPPACGAWFRLHAAHCHGRGLWRYSCQFLGRRVD
jgi:CSLREA domain-containing protein